jgi:antibiotic biosynthesis monooxygenase (ABM) superfamily enzyme
MTTTTANITTANTTDTTATAPVSQHRQALTVWLAVLPTLTVLQLVLGDFLTQVHPYLRPPIMATVAVPIVVYGVMPRLARLTARVARG